MDIQYRMNCGQYVLYDGDRPIRAPLDTVAIVLDSKDGVLHKHGSPDMVRKWHSDMTTKFRAAGLPQFAEHLVVIEGRFPLEELNRCVDCTTYIAHMYQRLLNGELPEQPIG